MQDELPHRHKYQWRTAYVVKRLLLKTIGPNRTLKISLRIHWILRRMSFELSGLVFGDKFQNSALGLSEELLSTLILPSDTVADLGCGTGRWSRACAMKAKKVFGIDANRLTLEEAKKLGGSVDYIELDLDTSLEKMPYVDLTLMIHFLEHIKNPLNLLKVVREKSKKIVIEVPDFESDPLNYSRIWTREPFYFDSDHICEFTLAELQLLLRKTDWSPSFIVQKGGTILIVAN